MRRIIRRREVVEDDARYAGEAGSEGTHTVASVAGLLSAVAQSGALPRAVVVEPTDEVEQLAPWLRTLSLIVVHFPAAGDGRGFSQARILRTRLRYTSELRARGKLKRDQLYFLARCGFDSFDLDAAEDLQASVAALDSFSVAYQDGSELLVHPRRRES